MNAGTVLLFAFGIAGLTIGGACVLQLRRWERQLRGVRIVVAFKGKNKMTPRLIDWLKWANSLNGDKATNAQVVYKMGGTTIAIVKPVPKQHGKTETRTIKEET